MAYSILNHNKTVFCIATCNSAPLSYLDEDGRITASCWYRGVFILKYTLYRSTRQKVHDTLIVVDRYLRLMGDKTIPDSAEPRLGSLNLPFVTGIDLPHQGLVDSYNLILALCFCSPPIQRMHKLVISSLYMLYTCIKHPFLLQEGKGT